MFKVYLKKLNPPFSFNGFDISRDSVIFDTKEDTDLFVNGKAAYDYLDNIQLIDTARWQIIGIEEI